MYKNGKKMYISLKYVISRRMPLFGSVKRWKGLFDIIFPYALLFGVLLCYGVGAYQGFPATWHSVKTAKSESGAGRMM